jgi:hypothetical protein
MIAFKVVERPTPLRPRIIGVQIANVEHQAAVPR